ncbi:hypothetical protein [Candidatus Tisiphia endosymbiont of Micropterix aruncella]|uniref:hypothetical protein n=1 Tax=Candidatus Tisiphia endosymbiont of Micropterix aruncella TaxID=3066271 RepID=UPI003AA80AB2
MFKHLILATSLDPCLRRGDIPHNRDDTGSSINLLHRTEVIVTNPRLNGVKILKKYFPELKADGDDRLYPSSIYENNVALVNS